MKIYVTSAFCKDGAGGNKAGVVFDHPELSREEKMEISRELGFSETAFVTSSKCGDYKIEYFTPTEEVPLCGHATIATFATMYHLGKISGKSCTIETGAGNLAISVAEDGLVMMQQNRPQYYDYLDMEELVPCLGEGVSKIPKSQIVSTGLKDMIVPFTSVETLNAAMPNFEKITELSRKKEVVGIHAFAFPKSSSVVEITKDCSKDCCNLRGGKLPSEVQVDAICRNFAPLYGIDEESATGTASCALAGFLYRNGLRKDQYVFEQGYSMNLPSRILVRITEKDASIDTIFVGGYGKVLEVRERSVPFYHQ